MFAIWNHTIYSTTEIEMEIEDEVLYAIKCKFIEFNH